MLLLTLAAVVAVAVREQVVVEVVEEVVAASVGVTWAGVVVEGAWGEAHCLHHHHHYHPLLLLLHLAALLLPAHVLCLLLRLVTLPP